MSDDSSSLLEEERSLFRPFTRESLIGIEARIAEELEKQKELEKRRAEGEVRWLLEQTLYKNTKESLTSYNNIFHWIVTSSPVRPPTPPFLVPVSVSHVYLTD